MKKKIKYYSYQSLDGKKYINAQVGDKSLKLKKKVDRQYNKFGQKIFVSRPLALAASIERRKRNLLNKIDERFNLPRYIDGNGKTIINEAVKRRLSAAGTKQVTTNDAKPTEIAKTGKIDPAVVGRRLIRKSKRVVGSVLKGGVNLADTALKVPVKAALTPGRLAVGAAEDIIKNPIAAGITASTYVAPFALPASLAAPIVAVDNAIPDTVQFKVLDNITPLPAPAKRWLKNKSREFVQSPVAKRIKNFQWGDALNAAGEGLTSIGNHSPAMYMQRKSRT